MNLSAIRFCRRACAALAVACLALVLCAPAHAARRTARHRPVAAAAATTTPVGAAGMLIARDPETGALAAPTTEQARVLTAVERTGLLRSSEGLSEVHLSDGSVKVDLQGRFMEYSLVQLDPTGCPHFLCVNDETMLRALLARYAPVSTPVYEEK